MQDTELFLSLAEIAGVFVGFGALIAIRSGGATEDFDVASVGTVVWAGIAVIFVALVAIVLGLLPDQEPALYLASVVLLLFMDAWLLLLLVFSVGRPQPASGPAALAATGGSSA
jgi:hypothetical protein